MLSKLYSACERDVTFSVHLDRPRALTVEVGRKACSRDRRWCRAPAASGRELFEQAGRQQVFRAVEDTICGLLVDASVYERPGSSDVDGALGKLLV